MIAINYFNKVILEFKENTSTISVQNGIKKCLGFCENDYYFLSNGKRFNQPHIYEKCTLHIIPKLVGGKGGFGSMLRAIGAQIEKTTNREACRDLSGRRLRDINEEKRLKTWIAQQVEREKEAEDRRQKKLERLCKTPKHEFKDENYEKERSNLTEKVEDALEQGLKASTSSGSCKRKIVDEKPKAKKKRLWLGSEDELSSSDNDSENEDNSDFKKLENNKLSSESENNVQVVEKIPKNENFEKTPTNIN